MSEKQNIDAVNKYVLNDDMLDELQYFKHKQSHKHKSNLYLLTHAIKTFIAEA
jgi:hypothetical protein